MQLVQRPRTRFRKVIDVIDLFALLIIHPIQKNYG